MKKYQMYSIGNALVDMDYKIPHELLYQLNLEKGTSTLIDEKQCQELLHKLGHYSENRAKSCAGSAVNTTILFSQLGGKSFYSGRIANDEFGDIFYKELERQGVATNIPATDRQQGSTGTCLVMVTPDVDRTMTTHLGVASSFKTKDLDIEAIKNSEYLYIEGYLLATDCSYEAAMQACDIAKKHDTKIVLTLSDRGLVAYFRQRFLDIINFGVELLFANELEAKVFAENDQLYSAAENLKKFSKKFAVTLGPNGALMFDGERLFESPAYNVVTLDSVGAGDIFAGSLLYSLTRKISFEKASEIANFASGLVVAKYGPRLDRNEITRVKQLIDASAGV